MSNKQLLQKSEFSSYESYPEYISTDEKWLGKIPKHWNIKYFKFAASLAYGDSLPSDTRDGGRFLVYGSNGPVGNHSSPNTGSPAIVIGRKGSYGKVNYSNSPCYAIDTTYYIDKTTTNENLRWLYYLLIALKLDSFSEDSAVPGLSREYIYNFKIPDISIFEQNQIALFFDEKTNLIDRIISRQEELIDLFEEKRTALISRAVTKGLDPEVDMKDSGVEWLGEIPKHWGMPSLSQSFMMIGSGTTPTSSNQEYYGGLIPWITSSELRENTITESTKRITEKALGEFRSLKIYPKGSLVVAMYGATIGRVGLLGLNATVNQACCVLSSPKTLNEEFAFFWFIAFRTEIINLALGGGQGNISQDIIKSLRVPTPPMNEQKKIVKYLSKEIEKVNLLITKVNCEIDLLNEYKSSLISAAVTGKIDVRK